MNDNETQSYDLAIHSNPDACAWADFFITSMAQLSQPCPDRETMIGWFANAMMAMHDHLKASAPPRAQATEFEVRVNAFGAAWFIRGRDRSATGYAKRQATADARSALLAAHADLAARLRAAEAERIEALEKAAGRERQLSEAWRKLAAAEERAEKAERERDEAYDLVYGSKHLPAFPDRFQTLPGWARKYIADIETNADPAGTVRSVADLREQRAGLALMLKEAESALAAAEKREAAPRKALELLRLGHPGLGGLDCWCAGDNMPDWSEARQEYVHEDACTAARAALAAADAGKEK